MLWHALLNVVRKFLVRLPPAPISATPTPPQSALGAPGPAADELAAVVAMLAERFNPETADGFPEPAAVAGDGKRRRGPKLDWLLTAPSLPAARVVRCAAGAEVKVSQVLVDLGLSATDPDDATTAVVLVGDFIEGLGRGLLGHRGVGPFFHRLSALLKARATAAEQPAVAASGGVLDGVGAAQLDECAEGSGQQGCGATSAQAEEEKSAWSLW